jgi:hypothetical protein
MADSKKTDRSAWWLAVAGAIGVVAGALVTGLFSHFDHKGDIDAKMIELSIGVLRAEPTGDSGPLREWAVETIEDRANFKFTPEQHSILVKRPLKVGAYSSNPYDSGDPTLTLGGRPDPAPPPVLHK